MRSFKETLFQDISNRHIRIHSLKVNKLRKLRKVTYWQNSLPKLLKSTTVSNKFELKYRSRLICMDKKSKGRA